MINAMPNPMQQHELLLPNSCRITPSKESPWRGTRRPDQRFTNPQLAVMPLYQLDPATCDFVVVRSLATEWELSWPKGFMPNPVYLCPCPIIQRKGADQLLVISPAGSKKWVYADGSITRQRVPHNARRSRNARGAK